jgi:hypothetical protein
MAESLTFTDDVLSFAPPSGVGEVVRSVSIS